jgi:hypothetical protein
MTSRRTLAAAAALALAALVAGVSMLAANTGSAHASSARTITLVTHYEQASLRTDDVAPKGQSVGDQIFFSGSLVRGGKPAGRLEDVDVTIDARIEGVMRSVTLLLPDGTIVAAGAGGNKGATGWHPSASDAIAVIGGTGAYRGASGEIVAHDLPNESQRLTVTLR